MKLFLRLVELLAVPPSMSMVFLFLVIYTNELSWLGVLGCALFFFTADLAGRVAGSFLDEYEDSSDV